MMKDLLEDYLPKSFVSVGSKRNLTYEITLKYTRIYNIIPLVEEKAKGNKLMFSYFNAFRSFHQYVKDKYSETLLFTLLDN